MNGKKDNIWLISLITSHRLRDLKRELESKTKKSKDNGAIIMISLISTFKTLPTSNFCFSDVKGFVAYRLLLKLNVKNTFSNRSSALLHDCKYMKIIYVHCGWRKEYGSDPRSYEHYLSSSEYKAWKIKLAPGWLVSSVGIGCTGIGEVMGLNSTCNRS